MTGGLSIKNGRNLTFRKADDSNQFAINPNVISDYFTNIYTFNSADGNGGVRFRVSQDQGIDSSSYDMLIALSGAKQDIGGVEYRGHFLSIVYELQRSLTKPLTNGMLITQSVM